MKSYIEGLEIEYDQQATMSLVARIDPGSSTRFIPYQIRMLRDNRIAKLLPLTVEEVNGIRTLRYDYTGRRRLVQMLRTEPPDYRQFLELAYLLVRTIAECAEYMLSEDGFVLHEELVFAGPRYIDFRLCYAPVEGKMTRSITDQLRCLLLKMISEVQGPIDPRLTSILSIISQEPYSMSLLANQLKHLWLGSDEDYSSHADNRWTKQTAPNEREQSKASLWNRLRNQLGFISKRPLVEEGMKVVSQAITGRTEKLSNEAQVQRASVKLVIVRDGKEENVEMLEERFTIGRSSRGVDYLDSSDGISRIHCELLKGEQGLEVKDLGSLNGTALNGEPLIPYRTYPFRSGDVLKLVRTEIRLAGT